MKYKEKFMVKGMHRPISCRWWPILEFDEYDEASDYIENQINCEDSEDWYALKIERIYRQVNE